MLITRKRALIGVIIALIVVLSMMLQACSTTGVAQEDYDKLLSEKEALEKEYADYKAKMEPFEKMTEAEAEEARLKAQQEIDRIAAENAAKAEAEAAAKAEEEAAAAAKKAEEEAAAAAAKAEEEAKGYETGITYDQLARTPDDYMDKKVKFYGTVVQVMEGDGEVQIRLAVDDDYDTILYGAYDSSIVSSRVLEDDEITIYGVSKGLLTYESTMGGNITIPAVLIEKIDQ